MLRLLACLALTVAMPVAAQSSQPTSAQSPYLSVEQLRAKYADKASHFVDIGGVSIHYKDEGKGPVLLMVHGSQSTLKTWDGIVAKLKGKYRIIRYDIAGQGLSGDVSDTAAAALKPTDIAEGLLKHLGVTKLKAGVGVSSGGTLIAFLASENPGLVERAILSNMPSDPVVTTHLKQPQSFIDAQAKAKATKVTDLAYWNEFLNYFSGDPSRISAKTRAEYADFNRRVPNKNVISLVAQIKDGKVSTVTFAEMTTPSLLIWGGSDQLLPVSAAKRLEEYLVKSEASRVIMPDVGHYPPLEVPERFADVMESWITSGVPNLPGK